MDADRGPLAPAGLDVCLQSCRGVAGLIHVIHNAANDLGSCMDHYGGYDSTVEDMTALSSFLRSRDSKERPLAKCFSRGDASHSSIRSKIEHFDAECYRPRWGTVAKCALELRAVLPAMRLGWNKEAYLEGSSAEQRTGSIETVDKLVCSSWFESYLVMLAQFSHLVLNLMCWVEGCPCHWRMLTSAASHMLSTHHRRLLERCPMRTRRAPELAAGDFTQELSTFSSQAGSELLCRFPPDLQEAGRTKVLQDFELGRSFLTTVLMLKTSHFRCLPWSAAALACHDLEKAREVWSSCAPDWMGTQLRQLLSASSCRNL